MKVGTIVNLNINSGIGDLNFKENKNDKYNPHKTEGKIIKIGNDKIPSNPVIVLWKNGENNTYEKGYKNSYEYRCLLEI